MDSSLLEGSKSKQCRKSIRCHTWS